MSNEFKDWVEEQSPIEKEITTKYPFLISPYARDAEGNLKPNIKLPLIPLEIPDGWLKLFYQMCDDTVELLRKTNVSLSFVSVDVCEGWLSCEYNIGGKEDEVDQVERIIDIYERMSQYVCQYCGRLTTYSDVSSFPLCLECTLTQEREIYRVAPIDRVRNDYGSAREFWARYHTREWCNSKKEVVIDERW